MSIKLNKKGSHVGLVVSFLIFIVFISFLRIILEPALVSNEEKKVILEDVEKELIEYREEIGLASKLRLMETEYQYQSNLADLKYVYEKELAEIAAREKAAEEARKAAEKAAEEKAKEEETGGYITWADLKKRFQTRYDTNKDGYIDEGKEFEILDLRTDVLNEDQIAVLEKLEELLNMHGID